MKRKEAEPITQALDIAHIPYSFYRQTGLWQSEEATHLDVLLRSLTAPDERASFRKALLTCFFRVRPEDLVRAPDVPMQHPARQLYQTWLGHVEARQWSALCRSLLEDTGLLFHDLDDTAAQRRLTNLRTMLTGLEQAGHGFNLDLLGMIDWLEDRRELRDTDGDAQPVDSTQAKVKIMTIHASKGLEFPVVFLAGGFTQRLGGGETNYRDEQQKIVFDLAPGDDARVQVQKEQLSEHRRLLYVAMTRPVFKLYVPRIKKPRRGNQYLGPLGTVLLPALDLASPDIKFGGTVVDVVAPSWDALTIKRDDVASPAPRPAPLTLPGPLFVPLDAGIGKRRIVTRSFSSMARHHLTAIGEGDELRRTCARPRKTSPSRFDGDDPLRGPVFGDMVHSVLEAIDFAEAGRATLPDDLLRAGTPARKRIDEEIRKSIALPAHACADRPGRRSMSSPDCRSCLACTEDAAVGTGWAAMRHSAEGPIDRSRVSVSGIDAG